MNGIVRWVQPKRALVDQQPSPEVAAIYCLGEIVEAQIEIIRRAAQRALFEDTVIDMFRQRADQLTPDAAESHRMIALAATGEFTRVISGVNRPRCRR